MNEIQTPAGGIQLPKAPSLDEVGGPAAAGRAGGSGGFGELVGQAVGEANRDLVESERQARLYAEGKSGIVETVMAMSKADLSLRFVVELRNRFVEAYREITRIQT